MDPNDEFATYYGTKKYFKEFGLSSASYDLWVALRADTAARDLFNQFYADYPNGAKIEGPEVWMAYPDREPQKYAATRDLLNGITSAFGYTQISFLAALPKAQELRTALAPDMGLTNAFEKLFSTYPSATIHKIKQALIIKAVLQPNYEKTSFMNALLPIAYIYEQVQTQQYWWSNANNSALYIDGFRFFDNVFGTNIPMGTPWTGAFLTDQDRNRLFYIYEISKSEMPLQYKTSADTDKIKTWIENVSRMSIILDTMKQRNPAFGPAYFGLPSNFNLVLPPTQAELTSLYLAAKNFGVKADAIETALKSDPALLANFDLIFDSRWKDKGAYDVTTGTYKPYMVFDFYIERVIFEQSIKTSMTAAVYLDAVKKAAAFVSAPLFQPTYVSFEYTPAGILTNLFGLGNQGYHTQWGNVLIPLVSAAGYTEAALRDQLIFATNLDSEIDHTSAETAFLELFRPTDQMSRGFALIDAAKMGFTNIYQFASLMTKTNNWIKSVLADPVKLAAFNTQYQTSLSASVYAAGIPRDLLKKLLSAMV